ncbi:MAG: hypothetical protein ACI841_000330, partial [Planctomycetota bacterium]
MSDGRESSSFLSFEFLDDFWNPILVKEVRQALRGRFFRVSFVLVLAALLIACAAMIIDMGTTVSSHEGRDFFFGIFVCLSAAVMGLVPFAAFNSMGAEWEENTFELLVISNLRPNRILIGKLLSAWTQSLLYFSAFTPFLVFAFLLRGIDLGVVGVMLITAQVGSVALSILAIFLSTLSKQRFVRIVLMAILSGALILAVIGVSVMTEGLLRRPGELRDRDFWLGCGASMIAIGTVASFCFLAACNMLAHSEENRSTGLRILSCVVLLIMMVFVGLMMNLRADRSALSGTSIMMIVCMLVPGTFFATEAERLGRRVRPRIPRTQLISTLVAPWLPGGSRGLILFSGQLLLIVLFSSAGHLLLLGPADRWADEGCLGVILAALYAFFYVALPSGLCSKNTGSLRLRSMVRASVPFLIMALAFGPALLGFFVKD